MLGAFAIVGFVVLPAFLVLDLLAPGRHFPARPSGLRLVAGTGAALAVCLGTGAALARLLSPRPAPETLACVLPGLIAGGLLARALGDPLDRVSRRGHAGLGLVTPAAWLDDRVARLGVRAAAGALVLFGVLHLPLLAGSAAMLVLTADPVRAVAAAVATRVPFEEPDPATAEPPGPPLRRAA